MHQRSDSHVVSKVNPQKYLNYYSNWRVLRVLPARPIRSATEQFRILGFGNSKVSGEQERVKLVL
jgi:hypothetical protein